MARRRIAIVGGGMAGLTAAFELTRTPRLREQFEVTVHQLGWRLGGKCASGVDEQGRNIEHGLHIWFGYYENTFALLNAVYDEWRPPAEQKIRRAENAVVRTELTPIGDGDEKNPGWYMVRYPTNDVRPGTGVMQPDVWNSLVGLMNVGAKFAEDLLNANPALGNATIDVKDPSMLQSARGGADTGRRVKISRAETPAYLRAIAKAASRVDVQHAWYVQGELLNIVDALEDLSKAAVTGTIGTMPMGNLMSQLLEIKAALAKGVVHDVLLGQKSIVELDRIDLREWLVQHGAPKESVRDSPYVTALYDTMFQYVGGDHAKPSYGAGTAVQVVLRMLGTYAGTLAWRVAAGTGSAAIAPLYQVLKARGVKFSFFHKLTRVGLLECVDTLDTLTFDRQVALADPRAEYEPLAMCNGLLSWGDEPPWDQIQGGADLKQDGIDLESHWCTQKVDELTLERGKDFDDAILAIPVGTFMPLSGDPGPCDQLIARSTPFRKMVQTQRLVPSVSTQLWSTKTLAQLGWKDNSPAAVAGPGTLGIWADMTQLLDFENGAGAKGCPKSLHYLCDVFKSDDYKLPLIPPDPSPPAKGPDQGYAHVQAIASAHKVAQKKMLQRTQQRAAIHKRDIVYPWFGTPALGVWGKAKVGGGKGKGKPQFDWNVLYVGRRRLQAAKRLDAQVVKFNVDPGGCCVCSAPGTTARRLRCDASGFDHLYLAGSWIDTGFNTECIEAAVMSGMQVARAISGVAREIPGEDFMHPESGDTSPCELARDAIDWLAGIA